MVINHNQNFQRIVVIRKVFGTRPTITCSKLTIETLEQAVKYVHS